MKHIIRQVPAEYAEFSDYFDCDGFNEKSGDYCNTLFIIYRDRGRIDGLNAHEYKRIPEQAEAIIVDFDAVRDGARDYDGRRYTYKRIMEDTGITYSPRICHALKAWSETADHNDDDDIAAYLTIITGKRWTTTSARGYCQGDYVDIIYCPERYPDGATKYGEIWLGAAAEFCIIDINDDGSEGETVYGYIVADSESHWDDDEYKRIICSWEGLDPAETILEMIDGQTTRTEYTYRAI